MALSLSRIRTIGLWLISPLVLFLLVILAQDFVALILQLYTGQYSPSFGMDLGFYLIFIPVALGYLGIRSILRMLSHSV